MEEDHVPDLIRTKVQLAQSEERSLEKDRRIKNLQDELTFSRKNESLVSLENANLKIEIARLEGKLYKRRKERFDGPD